MGLLRVGAQLHIRTNINLSVLRGRDKYLCYEEGGDLGLTHRAVVAPQEEGEVV